ATVAKVIDRFEDETADDILPVGNIRKKASASLLDADKRYSGKATSRKALQEELWGDALSEEGSAEEGSEEWYSGSEDPEEDGSLGSKTKEKPSSAGSDREDDLGDDEETDDLSVKAKATEFSFQNVTDFEKFTEGMDDVGSSEGEGEDDASMEEGSDEEECGSGEDDSLKETKDTEDDGGVMTFSKRQDDDEIEKGKAVRNQIVLCDHLLEARIKMQKALMTANRLPQPDTYPIFKKEGGQEFDKAVENC
ncbi:AATF protein, partial [Trogon melanurus]|nr:AATF protein [Trogon melanurus]